MALNVESRVGFGIAEALCLGQRIGERQPLLAHLGQDVVGGPVDDAGDPFDMVCRQPFAQRLDDRDAAGHRGLERDHHALFARPGKDFVAVLGQQLLVGRDHVLAMIDGGQHQVLGDAGTADQFDHDVDIRMGRDHAGIADNLDAVADNFARPGNIEIGRHFQHDRTPGTPADFFRIAFENGRGAAADRADAHDAYIDRLHRHSCYRLYVPGIVAEYATHWACRAVQHTPPFAKLCKRVARFRNDRSGG